MRKSTHAHTLSLFLSLSRGTQRRQEKGERRTAGRVWRKREDSSGVHTEHRERERHLRASVSRRDSPTPTQNERVTGGLAYIANKAHRVRDLCAGGCTGDNAMPEHFGYLAMFYSSGQMNPVASRTLSRFTIAWCAQGRTTAHRADGNEPLRTFRCRWKLSSGDAPRA